MNPQPQPVSRLRTKVGPYSIVEEDHALQSVPPFVILNSFAKEVERFHDLEEARRYAAQLAEAA